MQPGQFLVNKNGEKRKILGVCGELYGLSYLGGEGEYNHNSFGHWCSKKDLEEQGWSLLEEPWKPGKNDAYWYVSMDGKVYRTKYRNWLVVTDEEHEFKLKIGNVHRTREDAEAYKQKLIERMGSKE